MSRVWRDDTDRRVTYDTVKRVAFWVWHWYHGWYRKPRYRQMQFDFKNNNKEANNG
jgi:hypothetical protein